jgi:hypothetical protein
VTDQAPLAAGEPLTGDAAEYEGAVEDFATDDIAAMREQGDLPAFMRLQIRPARAPIQVMTLWQRFSGPTGHKPGAWPSSAPLGPYYRRAPGEPDLCDCARCLALAAPCGDHPCRCPQCGSEHAPAA